MNRTSLIIALALATVVGLLFGFYPYLDLAISRPFFAVVDRYHNVFAWRLSPPLMDARNTGLLISALLVAPAVISLVMKLVLPRRRSFISGRAMVFLVATMALGPGLLVNVALKDHWGRPRPIDVIQFGGHQHFVAWWDPRGDCPDNCSFVSGDVSGAAWTFAPAALAPPQWRALAYAGAFALTAAMTALRLMAGGHFFTDAVFAAIFTFLIVWFVYGLVYRWPRTQLSDAQIDDAIARVSLTALASRWLGRRDPEVEDWIPGPRPKGRAPE